MLEITLLTLSFDDNDEWLEQRVFINVETNDFSFCFVSFLCVFVFLCLFVVYSFLSYGLEI